MFNVVVVVIIVAVVVGYVVGPHLGLFLSVLVAVDAKRRLLDRIAFLSSSGIQNFSAILKLEIKSFLKFEDKKLSNWEELITLLLKLRRKSHQKIF